ncbi:MAG: hypothetical protein NDF57_07390 [archaeon GBS-70-058]|nr:hypothetical protein [Candidatus Culexarchaeum nevadense]
MGSVVRGSVLVAYTAIFAALAILLTFGHAEVPFPILPYLKFDFAEIPVMLALFLGGFGVGFSASVIHWIVLTIARGWFLGPLMKFLAVAPMVIGSWFGIRLVKDRSIWKTLAMALILGIIFRVIAGSITNIVVLLWVAPDYLKFSTSLLKTIGFNISSETEALTLTLWFTAIFNTIHVLLSSILAYIIFKATIKILPSTPKTIKEI